MINKIFLCFWAAMLWSCNPKVSGLKNGDIIFQTSQSSQSLAIQIATGSEWSHCGIIYIKNNKPYVFEASTKVKLSPLGRFIKKGKDRKYVVKRVKNSGVLLTREALLKMKQAGEKFDGLPYDPFFEWSDESIYCSELVWKIYKRALGIEIGGLQRLGEFDLSHPAVKAKLKERYGKEIPLDEVTISPVAMFNSELLEKVAVAVAD